MCSFARWRFAVWEILRPECKVVETGDVTERVTVLRHYV